MAIDDSGAAGSDSIRARPALRAFATTFGLRNFETHRSQEDDGIVAIETAASGSRAGYIPYSNRPLSWHTDGYYNYHGPSDCVKAMVLHCVRDAAGGGVSALLDHEIAYIRLRDRDPAFIEALTHPEAMTIPAGEDGYGGPRPDNTGPVFFINPETQVGRHALHCALEKALSATTFCTTAQGSRRAQTEMGASFTACASTTGLASEIQKARKA